jgi:aminodeoxyfutalosine synthase
MTVLEVVADRVARGERLDAADARAVLGSYDLIAIGMMGDEVRRRMHGDRTTFVRVFEVHVEAPASSLPQATSAGEFRIVGRAASLDGAVTAVRAARALAGSAPVTGYALRDLFALAPEPAALGQFFAALRSAGLDAIAEVAVDDASDLPAAITSAREAGIAVPRLIVHSLALPAETTDRGMAIDMQIAALERARTLQDTLGGFHAFAPLPREVSIASPTTGYDDVKLIALARLIVTNIESIQVNWAQYGPKLAQVGLTVGADDVDSVEAVDPGMLGTRRSALEEIRRNIRAAALEPVERDGLFRASPSSPESRHR